MCTSPLSIDVLFYSEAVHATETENKQRYEIMSETIQLYLYKSFLFYNVDGQDMWSLLYNNRQEGNMNNVHLLWSDSYLMK